MIHDIPSIAPAPNPLPAMVRARHRPRVQWLPRWLLTALLTLANLAALAPPARAQFVEYDVKAAFLASFAQFVKWPPAAFSDPAAPFSIGILGDDPFGGSLEKIVKGQTVAGRKIVIRRGRRPEDVRSCQVVFIAKSERRRLAELIAGLQGASILIVGESEQFTRQGGAIGFTMEADKVRFEINSGSAQRAGLELSSRLMKLGRGAAPP